MEEYREDEAEGRGSNGALRSHMFALRRTRRGGLANERIRRGGSLACQAVALA